MEANPTIHEVDTLIFVTPGAALATDARGHSCMSVMWLVAAGCIGALRLSHFNDLTKLGVTGGEVMNRFAVVIFNSLARTVKEKSLWSWRSRNCGL